MTTNSPTSSLVIGIVSGLIGGVVGALAFSGDAKNEPAPAAEVSVSDADLQAMEQRILDRVTPKLQASAVERTGMPTVDPADVRNAVAALLAENPEIRAGLDTAAVAEATATPEVDEDFPSPKEFADLVSKLDPDSAEARDLWKRAKELGLTDVLLAEFDARVEAAPNNPVVQLEGARAYLLAAQQDPMRPDPSWWARSDELYSTTLELDPNHWDARMEKAVTLTFWPDIMGRKPEAIGHFETLISQAERLPAEDRHADAYVMLGNMHMQRGNPDAAREVWQRGLTRHPGHGDLTQRLGQ